MINGATAYGASSASVTSACAVLRARATKNGLQLRPAPATDLAAAAVTVELWAACLGADSLELTVQYGIAALRTLAAGLARSAGHGTEVCWPATVAEAAQLADSGALEAVEPAVVAALTWAASQPDVELDQVALRAASALLLARSGTLAAAAHALMDVTSETTACTHPGRCLSANIPSA